MTDIVCFFLDGLIEITSLLPSFDGTILDMCAEVITPIWHGVTYFIPTWAMSFVFGLQFTFWFWRILIALLRTVWDVVPML